VDETCTKHELFDVYEDVCRVRAGKDHDWTVGMYDIIDCQYVCLDCRFGCGVKTTFNNISVISWQPVFLVEETGVPGESHRPIASH